MNLQLIATPPRQREIAMLTAELRRAVAVKASYCVRWLATQGFDVLRVEPGLMGPRIIIRECRLCDKLEGVVPAFSRGIKGAERYKFVFRCECEVRWTVKNAAVMS